VETALVSDIGVVTVGDAGFDWDEQAMVPTASSAAADALNTKG
jgi:hypothetical protein